MSNNLFAQDEELLNNFYDASRRKMFEKANSDERFPTSRTKKYDDAFWNEAVIKLYEEQEGIL